MELSIKFTARPSPERLTRALVLIVTVIIVLVIKKAGYWPGTAFPAVLSVGLAAAQASRALLPDHVSARVTKPNTVVPAAPSV